MIKINGRAVEDYKRFEVREDGLAVPRAEPLYVPAISNGYHPDDSIIDSSLVLYLPLYLLKGSKFKTLDRYSVLCEVTGALWGPTGRDFDGSGDLIEISAANSTHLDFTSGAFSGMVWVKPDVNNVIQMMMQKGAIGVDGWWFHLDSNRVFDFRTSQSGANQITGTDETGYIKDIWQCLGFTRSGAAALVYKAGVDVTTNAGTHTDPASASNNKFHVGINDAENARKFNGKTGEVWMWSRQLSAADMLHAYNVTRWRYQ